MEGELTPTWDVCYHSYQGQRHFFSLPDIHIHRACAQLMSRKIKWLWIKNKPYCSPNLIESYLVHLIRILNSNWLTRAPQLPAKSEPGSQEQVKVSPSPPKSQGGWWIWRTTGIPPELPQGETDTGQKGCAARVSYHPRYPARIDFMSDFFNIIAEISLLVPGKGHTT